MTNSIGQAITVSGTAAGTVVVRDRAFVLDRVIIPASATGTITFYNQPSGVPAAGNLLFTLVNDTVDFPHSVECGVGLNGLTCVVGGTTSMVVVAG